RANSPDRSAGTARPTSTVGRAVFFGGACGAAGFGPLGPCCPHSTLAAAPHRIEHGQQGRAKTSRGLAGLGTAAGHAGIEVGPSSGYTAVCGRHAQGSRCPRRVVAAFGGGAGRKLRGLARNTATDGRAGPINLLEPKAHGA